VKEGRNLKLSKSITTERRKIMIILMKIWLDLKQWKISLFKSKWIRKMLIMLVI